MGCLGLHTWRKELTGKAKFDVARNVMLLGFKLAADFGWVRHPLTRSNESADRQRQKGESEKESAVLDEWYAKSRRLQPLVEDLQKLQEAGWEAEILLGKDSSKQVSETIELLRKSYAELSSAIHSYFDVRRDEAVTDTLYQNQNWLKELRKTIYSTGNDDFSKQIEDAINNLGSALKTYVK